MKLYLVQVNKNLKKSLLSHFISTNGGDGTGQKDDLINKAIQILTTNNYKAPSGKLGLPLVLVSRNDQIFGVPIQISKNEATLVEPSDIYNLKAYIATDKAEYFSDKDEVNSSNNLDSKTKNKMTQILEDAQRGIVIDPIVYDYNQPDNPNTGQMNTIAYKATNYEGQSFQNLPEEDSINWINDSLFIFSLAEHKIPDKLIIVKLLSKITEKTLRQNISSDLSQGNVTVVRFKELLRKYTQKEPAVYNRAIDKLKYKPDDNLIDLYKKIECLTLKSLKLEIMPTDHTPINILTTLKFREKMPQEVRTNGSFLTCDDQTEGIAKLAEKLISQLDLTRERQTLNTIFRNKGTKNVNNFNKNNIGSKGANDKTCHYCKKPGHLIDDCFLRKENNKGRLSNITAGFRQQYYQGQTNAYGNKPYYNSSFRGQQSTYRQGYNNNFRGRFTSQRPYNNFRGYRGQSFQPRATYRGAYSPRYSRSNQSGYRNNTPRFQNSNRASFNRGQSNNTQWRSINNITTPSRVIGNTTLDD